MGDNKMSGLKPWTENLVICGDNLSIYYVLSGVVSIGAVLLTWWIQSRETNSDEPRTSNDRGRRKESRRGVNNGEDIPGLKEMNDARKQLRLGKTAILDQVAKSLSRDQLELEKETVRKQLENILQLLKKEHDNSEIATFEELQEQLKFYSIPETSQLC